MYFHLSKVIRIVPSLSLCLGILLAQSTPARAQRNLASLEVYNSTEMGPPEEAPPKKSKSKSLPRKTVAESKKQSVSNSKSIPVSLTKRIEALETQVTALREEKAKEVKAREEKANEAKEVVAFDIVPTEQKEGIAQRLKLVDQLIRKYGRAYDYRNHTLKSLQDILAQLDAESAGGSAGAPATDAAPVQSHNSSM